MPSSTPTWSRYVQSLRDRETHWRIGPLRAHRGCAWGLTAEGKPRGCGSPSCRPGDPYGCAMLDGRRRRDQVEHIVGSWLARGHAAYLGMVEVVSDVDVPLRVLLQVGQLSVDRSLGSGSWHRASAGVGIAGQIRTLTVSRTRDGRWILRRWIVWAAREANTKAMKLAVDDAQRRLRGLAGDGCWTARLRGPVIFSSASLQAVAALVSDTREDFDVLQDVFADSLALQFGISPGEHTPARMAAAYRVNPGKIAERFRSLNEKADVRRSGLRLLEDGRLRVQIEYGNGSLRFARAEISPEGMPFVEYAVTLADVPIWSARRTSDSEWNGLVAEAQKIRPRYAATPARTGKGDRARRPSAGKK